MARRQARGARAHDDSGNGSHGHHFEIVSYGQDGQPGGDSCDADLTNRTS